MIMTKQTNSILKEKSSFRDPSGYLFVKNGDLYRLIKTLTKKNMYTFVHPAFMKSLLIWGFL